MNSAARLLAIVEFFNAVPKHDGTLAAWHRYLEMEPTGSEETALIATQAALAEIRSVESKLTSLGVPQELFSETATLLRAAFSPTQLAVPWSNHKEVIARRVVELSLKWASWTLSRFDETDIPEESMKALQDALSAQEQLLSQTDLPASLREMLERQLEEMKVALVLYKIKGVKPLVDVTNKQYGEFMHVTAEAVKDFDSAPLEAKNAVAKGAQLLGQFARVCEMGSNISNFGKDLFELGKEGWTLVLPYIPK